MKDRLRVVLTQVNTYLVLLSVFVTIVAAEVAPLLNGEFAEMFAQWAATVLAWLGAASAIIRRSTEVPLSERGILPTEDDQR